MSSIDLQFDSSVSSAPAGFIPAMNAAANFLQNEFSDPITVTINVGWGELAGKALPGDAIGASSFYLQNFAYSQLKTAFATDAKSADDATALAHFAITDPTGGGNFWVTTAQAKALGLIANDTQLDGSVGFDAATPWDFDNSNGVGGGQYDFFGTAVHELTEVLGRYLNVGEAVGSTSNSYTLLDLFHYAAAGTRDFVGSTPGYFSLDGGAVNLGTFNTDPSGDYGDWNDSADSFAAFADTGTVDLVNAFDLREMDALGWDLVSAPPPSNADLAPVSASFDGSTLAWTTVNHGSADAGASQTGVYLSSDGTLTTSDILLFAHSTPSLAASTSTPESSSVVMPSDLTPGTYYLGLIANYDGAVSESSTADNAVVVTPVLLGGNSNDSLAPLSGPAFEYGQGGDDRLYSSPGNDRLDGGPGSDTADYGNAGSAVVVDLNAQGVSQNTGGAGSDTLVSIENVTGSAFNDSLVGDGADNIIHGGDGGDTIRGGEGNNSLYGEGGDDVLVGGSGADILDGGSGHNYVDYSAAPSAIAVDLNLSGYQGTGGGGSDSLANVQGVYATDFNDNIVGDANRNDIHGGDGGDTLMGGAGDDNLYGGNGDDVLIGGPGDDILDGGPGHDYTSYSDAPSAVAVDLNITASYQGTGGSGSDWLISIEEVYGSNFNDNIVGDGADNRLFGAGGGDTLNGGGGNDDIVGGAGTDVLTGGPGNDSFHFEALGDSTVAGPDLITDFSPGDRIYLSLIDADTTTPGDQAFHVGSTPGHTSDIVVSYDAGSNTTTLYLYVDADSTPDARITLMGDHHDLSAGDFGL